jgi:hypothetical protein
MSRLPEINFGLLDENEIYFLKNRLEHEIKKREKEPEQYMKVVHVDDGAEGFYCPINKFHKIPSRELHGYIARELAMDSEVTFRMIDLSKEEYEENGKQYEWNFNDEESVVTFRAYHDDQPDEIIDRIATALNEFGIEIKQLTGGDGFVHFQIIETNEIKD